MSSTKEKHSTATNMDGAGPSTIGPLSGYVILDLTRALAGPHAGMMMGDLGAKVIKIESVDVGDDTRGWGPPFVGPEENPQATYFLSCNRNKLSLSLNLKDQEHKAKLVELIKNSDVLMENFRAGVLDRLGFSVQVLHELNPRLVIMSITGFGHDGPEAHRSGYDQILQGEAGLMSITGSGPEDPQKVGVPIADLLSGMYGAYGVLAALLEREKTGLGQVVRTSLLASIIGVHAFQGTRATVAGQNPQAIGNHHPSIAPYGLYACKDSKIQISIGSQKLWQNFATTFNLPADDPRFVDNQSRVANRPALNLLIEQGFAQYNAEDLLRILDDAGIPSGKVRSIEEVYEWEQVKSQGLIVEVEHEVLGKINLPGPPLRFFDPATNKETTRTAHAAPPVLNSDADEIEQWLLSRKEGR